MGDHRAAGKRPPGLGLPAAEAQPGPRGGHEPGHAT
jgi:hypothetical protein